MGSCFLILTKEITMKVTPLQQDSQAWLEWRDTGLGASDAATILAMSPYETPYGLWQIKTGRKQPSDLSRNPNVQRGNRLEPLARKVAEKYIGKTLYPLCAAEEVENFILTSFDGITKNRKIVAELKCPHPSTFADVLNKGEEAKAYKLYWVQCQQQLLVSNAEKAYLIFFMKGYDGQKDRIIPFEVFPDKTFQQEVLLPKLKWFWECIQTDTPPERDPKRDPCEVDGKSWLELAIEYHPLKTEIKALKAQLKEMEAQVKPYEAKFVELMGDNYKANEAGIKVSRSERKQGVDNELLVDELLSILKKRNINISKEALNKKHCKGKGKSSYRFTVSGNVELPAISSEEDQNQDQANVGWF
jgi:putative phage-type endonuclease